MQISGFLLLSLCKLCTNFLAFFLRNWLGSQDLFSVYKYQGLFMPKFLSILLLFSVVMFSACGMFDTAGVTTTDDEVAGVTTTAEIAGTIPMETIQAARVYLYAANDPTTVIDSAEIAENGSFSFDSLSAGDYAVYAPGQSGVAYSFSVLAVEDSTVLANLVTSTSSVVNFTADDDIIPENLTVFHIPATVSEDGSLTLNIPDTEISPVFYTLKSDYGNYQYRISPEALADSVLTLDEITPVSDITPPLPHAVSLIDGWSVPEYAPEFIDWLCRSEGDIASEEWNASTGVLFLESGVTSSQPCLDGVGPVGIFSLDESILTEVEFEVHTALLNSPNDFDVLLIDADSNVINGIRFSPYDSEISFLSNYDGDSETPLNLESLVSFSTDNLDWYFVRMEFAGSEISLKLDTNSSSATMSNEKSAADIAMIAVQSSNYYLEFRNFRYK